MHSYNYLCCNYSVRRFLANPFPVQVPRHNLKDRAHPLAEHFDLLVQIDYVKSDRDTRVTRFDTEIKPGSIVVLELRAMTIVLCPQVELVIRRVFGI